MKDTYSTLSETSCWIPGSSEEQGEPAISFSQMFHLKDILFQKNPNPILTHSSLPQKVRKFPAITLPFRILQFSDLQCNGGFLACYKTFYKNTNGQAVLRHLYYSISSRCPSCLQLLLTGFLPQLKVD